MKAGLYGKLIAKRDFIAIDLPQGFLAKWEPWLHGAVTNANLQLGARWQQTFFTAPLWRFWLGREVLGVPVMGVLMPSMDGVGRQFPLCLVAAPTEGRQFRTPFQDQQAAWFEAAEDFLLSTLDEGVPFEATLAGLNALAAPDAPLSPDLPEGVSAVSGGLLALTIQPDQHDLPLRLAQYARLQREEPRLSYWWTIGGEGFPPTALIVEGLPEQSLFLRMLASPVRPAEMPAVVAVSPPDDAPSLAEPELSAASTSSEPAPEPPINSVENTTDPDGLSSSEATNLDPSTKLPTSEPKRSDGAGTLESAKLSP